MATTDPNRNTTTTSWDANRRLTNAISPPGVGGALTTSYAYDANGSLLQAQQSSNGQFLRVRSKLHADRQDRDHDRRQGAGHRYAYDSVDRLSQTIDPVGNVTDFGYDALSRPALSTPRIQANPAGGSAMPADSLIASLSVARSNTVSDTTQILLTTYFDRLSATTYPATVARRIYL